MNSILTFLDGKKTYLACAAIFALLFCKWQGWCKIPDEVYIALMTAGLAFLRLGISKIPKPPLLCFLCFLLLNFGCVSPDRVGPPVYSPIPGPSPWTNGIPSLSPIRDNSRNSRIALSAVPASTPSTPLLAWSWPYPDTNVTFEIYRAPVLSSRIADFARYTNAPYSARSIPIPPGFYIARTRSTTIWDPSTKTFAVSDWSRKLTP